MKGVTYKITCGGKRNRMHIAVALHITGNLPPPTNGEREKPKHTMRHHVDEVHRNDEEKPRFKMEVLRVFGGDVLLRQVSEAVHIREKYGQMNRQQGWRQIQLPHVGLLV